jgi:hypothetical protein
MSNIEVIQVPPPNIIIQQGQKGDTGPAGLGLGVAKSIVNNAGNAELDGDLLSPGNNKVYGTDAGGVRGWKNDPAGASPDREIRWRTGNGFGSTNTEVRRFSNSIKDTGSPALTFNQSATLGDSITINETGLYAISFVDQGLATAVAANGAITRNATSVVTASSSGDLLVFNQGLGASGVSAFISLAITVWLTAGHVIRFLSLTPANTISASAYTRFSIVKLF